MSTRQPLISVLIPVYNGNGFLAEAVNSIARQTYKNLEIIAIDDGSTDDSYRTLQTLQKRYRRLRIYRHRQNQNISRTLNQAIRLARGQYLARMDADDIALPHRLEKQLHYLQNHPEVVIVGGQCQTIDLQSKAIGHKTFPQTDRAIREAIFTGNPLQHPAVMINRRLLPKNFSWYRTDLPPAEDYDLFFRLGKYGRYHNLQTTILQYRLHLGSATFHNPVKTFNTTKKVRHLAVTQYGYRPSLRSWLIHFLQVFLIAVLPDSFIYPLYSLARGIRSLKLPSPSFYLPRVSTQP